MAVISFQITGEYITNITRSFYIEGEYKKAMNILDSIENLPYEEKIAILEGRRKLIGINELDLEDDNVKEHDGSPLLPVIDQLQAEINKHEEESQNEKDIRCDLFICSHYAINGSDYYEVASPWGPLYAPCYVTKYSNREGGNRVLSISLEEFEHRFPNITETAKSGIWCYRRGHPLCMDNKEKTPNTNIMTWSEGQSNFDRVKFVEEICPGSGVLFEEITPELGDYTDRNGWLLPDGRFYKCKYYQHSNLLVALGQDEQKVEKTWLRVQHPDDRPIKTIPYEWGFYELRKLTKKQINFIWDYCQHHGIKYPQDKIDEL